METIIGYEAPPGRPYIGQLAEVAIGTYTEIQEIVAPAQAASGDLVTVEARVRNLYTGAIYIATTARYNGIDILPTEDYAIVDPGATRSFYFSFTMPNNDIKLDVWSFYWTGAEWYQDDYSYVDIALVIPPEEKEVNMGFTLKVINAPLEAVLWNANFAERTFEYDPMADSGWLGIDEVWEYPSDPLGCTTLRIWALDADNNILFDVYNLGPIEDGKDYTYDYTTGVLYEAAVSMLLPLAIIGSVVGVLGIGVVMASAMAKG